MPAAARIRSPASSATRFRAALAGELGYPASAEAMLHRLAALDGRNAVLVAEHDGACAGWIQVAVVVSLGSGRFAEIRGLVVAETHGAPAPWVAASATSPRTPPRVIPSVARDLAGRAAR